MVPWTQTTKTSSVLHLEEETKNKCNYFLFYYKMIKKKTNKNSLSFFIAVFISVVLFLCLLLFLLSTFASLWDHCACPCGH